MPTALRVEAKCLPRLICLASIGGEGVLSSTRRRLGEAKSWACASGRPSNSEGRGDVAEVDQRQADPDLPCCIDPASFLGSCRERSTSMGCLARARSSEVSRRTALLWSSADLVDVLSTGDARQRDRSMQAAALSSAHATPTPANTAEGTFS